MLIQPLRSNSTGIQATIANANHHAKRLIPLITQLSIEIPKMKYARWRQGNNIHILETTDGRSLVFRGLQDEKLPTQERYIGLSVLVKVSRNKEIHLFTITVDQGIAPLLLFLAAFAEPEPHYFKCKSADEE